jgi:hypothetical protein
MDRLPYELAVHPLRGTTIPAHPLVLDASRKNVLC